MRHKMPEETEPAPISKFGRVIIARIERIDEYASPQNPCRESGYGPLIPYRKEVRVDLTVLLRKRGQSCPSVITWRGMRLIILTLHLSDEGTATFRCRKIEK